MHHLDLGLFNYQVTFTRELLKELCGQVAVNELDNHLSSIPRFPGLKIFKNGLENIKRFTANEFRNMMKVFLFVIERIIKKHHKPTTVNTNDANDMIMRWLTFTTVGIKCIYIVDGNYLRRRI